MENKQECRLRHCSDEGPDFQWRHISVAFVEKVKAVHGLEGINMDMTVRPWEFKRT